MGEKNPRPKLTFPKGWIRDCMKLWLGEPCPGVITNSTLSRHMKHQNNKAQFFIYYYLNETLTKEKKENERKI